MKFSLKTKCFALKFTRATAFNRATASSRGTDFSFNRATASSGGTDKTILLKYMLILLINYGMMSCNFNDKSSDKLPIIGERLGFMPNGDTLYPSVPSFSFINQDSQIVTNKDFDNKIYVVDFFFTHCPTICPKVTANMLRIYERFKDSANVSLLSHSIDTKYDTVGRLKDYADRMGVKAPKWHFITGNQDSIYQIADKYYLVIPSVDKSIPGGFNHDGRLVLVDKQKRVRSFCDGTDAKDVDRFMKDIETLLREL